jgi:hypothetical protein
MRISFLWESVITTIIVSITTPIYLFTKRQIKLYIKQYICKSYQQYKNKKNKLKRYKKLLHNINFINAIGYEFDMLYGNSPWEGCHMIYNGDCKLFLCNHAINVDVVINVDENIVPKYQSLLSSYIIKYGNGWFLQFRQNNNMKLLYDVFVQNKDKLILNRKIEHRYNCFIIKDFITFKELVEKTYIKLK